MPFLIGSVIALLLGLGVGYYLGYDHGFEQAVRDVSTDQIVAEMNTEERTGPTEQESVRGRLIGEWQSVDDATFARAFRADGIVTDAYGDEETDGTWTVFISPTDEQAPFSIEPGVTYLKITMIEEVLYFTVSTVTDDRLELAYLDLPADGSAQAGRGDSLTFERVR